MCSTRSAGVEDELEYLPWEPHETLQDTKQWVEEQDRRWSECEGATYVMRARECMDVEAGTLVGITTFETYWERKAGEQMIFLRRPFYGQGLFAESCYEFMDWAFEDAGLEMTIADAVEGNERARNLFQRGVEAFGGRYDGVLRNRLPTDDGVKNVRRYPVTRERYRETMGSAETGSDETAAVDDAAGGEDDAEAEDASASAD